MLKRGMLVGSCTIISFSNAIDQIRARYENYTIIKLRLTTPYDLPMAAMTLDGTAGALRFPPPFFPPSPLADKTAALIAKKAVSPARKGGSPTPFDE